MEDFVSYDIAVKLKEKGFKEKCIAYYWENINEHTPSFVVEDNIPDEGICILDLLSEHNKAEWSPFVDTPTIDQVLKWLREKEKIHIVINITTYGFINSTISFNWDRSYCENEIENYDHKGYNTYEQAALAGIEYAIDNLI